MTTISKLCACFFLFQCMAAGPVYAADEIPWDTEAEQLEPEDFILSPIEMEEGGEVLDFSDAVESRFQEVEITEQANGKARSNMQFTNGILNASDSLTAADPNDLYLFSTDESKFMALSIESSNPNYAVVIASVDYSTGSVTATGVGTTAADTSTFRINGVSKGDWALYVYSMDGSVGDSYTIKCNVTNRTGVTAFDITPDFKYCFVQYNGSGIYANGTLMDFDAINGKEVKWEVHDSWPLYNPSSPTHPGTEYLDMTIQEGTVQYIGYGPFLTNRMSIPHALWVRLDVGTLWSYNSTKIAGGDYLNTMVDIRGAQTPRRFDSEDAGRFNGDHFLIYNLDTGSYVNFYSIYNPYFAYGGEKLSSGSDIVFVK